MIMDDAREYWEALWDEKATKASIFEQMGSSSHTAVEFFKRVTDMVNAVGKVNSTDTVLDAGCGPGWVAIALSPFVREVVMFDFSKEQVKRARENAGAFENISIYQSSIEDMGDIKSLGKKFDKVIVGSVLQYLPSYETIEKVFKNIHGVMAEKSICVFTNNPDIRKKQEHIKSYERLDWDNERMQKALETEGKRFWFDLDRLLAVADSAGFARSYETPINPDLFQSTHMFDFVVEK